MKILITYTLLLCSVQISAQSNMFFERVTLANEFMAVSNGNITYSDIDNDGDEDVLITGTLNNGDGSTKLYINDGNGFFAEALGTSFPDIRYGDAAFSDIDNDGDNDILITGFLAGTHITKLYKNNGLGDFTEVLVTPFIGGRSFYRHR